MGIVYRNIKDMDVPSFAYPNRHDGTVFIITVDENGGRHRKTIGALLMTMGRRGCRQISILRIIIRICGTKNTPINIFLPTK